MTRALITDEVRTGHSMGPVQLGYVLCNNALVKEPLKCSNELYKLINKNIVLGYSLNKF